MTATDDPALTALFDAASAARARAYAPYSGFHVAAALSTPDGAIFCGVNVENASYPVGTCAEAGAIAAMALSGARRIAAILILGDGEGLTTPCGACRQRILEFSDGGDVEVFVAGPMGVRARFSARALLPAAFGPDFAARKTPAQDKT